VIRTLVAEPTTLTREGLVALLNRERDIECIAAVQRADDALTAARALRPDVAVLAAAFPDMDGIAVAQALHDKLPGCHCAILSQEPRPGDLQRVFEAHLHGFLAHDCPAEFIAEAVRQLATGNKVIDPRLTFSVLDALACPLTIREGEALKLAAQGLTTAEIAAGLCLSTGTVRNYLSRAIAKTGGRNRVDAIRIAGQEGWL
jgi:two-component system response regulator DesR